MTRGSCGFDPVKGASTQVRREQQGLQRALMTYKDEAMTIKDTPTRQQMIEWLDEEMGLAQTRALKSGDDTKFYRLKAIRSELLAHADEWKSMEEAWRLIFEAQINDNQQAAFKLFQDAVNQAFKDGICHTKCSTTSDEPDKGDGK